MLFVMICRRTLGQKIILLFIPVKALFCEGFQHLKGCVQINLTLSALFELRQLDQATGRDRRRRGILPGYIHRLSEVHRNQAALRYVGNEIIGDPLCGFQIRLILCVQIA